jgi:SAM-dependent methyltransferase
MAAMLDGLDLVRPADTVLDIGCGPGAMVPGLLRRLGPSGRYVGFDVHEASISWCRNRWADDARLRFELAPIATPYGPTAGSGAETYRFPVSDGAADLVLAKSVFTHLPEEPARHYLAEVRRTLRPGRAAVVTAFLFDAAGPALPLVRTGFPHEGHAGLVRWRRRTRPTAAIAYDRSLFSEMTAAAGLRIIWMSPGFFPGASRPAGQDVLLLGI